MSNDVVVAQKPPTPILDKFKAILKEREEEIRIMTGDPAPPPAPGEIVRYYEEVLAELTFNSKPIITDLTIIAGEQREHGEGIADAICDRIFEVPVEQKLPSLYLLDSIVKNIGKEYVRHFSARLPEVFCEAYIQIHPNMHPSMRHLFGTWSAVFPSSVLHKIEAELQFSPSASESPRPTHGIHVNPKYLEARRQLEHSSADYDIQPGRGTSSLKIHGKPAIAYDGYDSDNAEVTSLETASQRLSSTSRAGRTSFAFEAEKLLPSSAARIARSSSPFRIGHARPLSPAVDEFPIEGSPGRIAERASPSHSGFGRGRDEEAADWRRLQWSNDTHQRHKRSAEYSLTNGELRRPRALIDAYGADQGKRNLNHKPPMTVINGNDSKATARAWQNTEEEEFDWEDISRPQPGTDLLPSSVPPSGSSRMRPGFVTSHYVPSETDPKRGSWSKDAQLSRVNNSSVGLQDAVPFTGSGQGMIDKMLGFGNGATQSPGPQYYQDLPQDLPMPSQPRLNAKGSGRNFQIPFSAISSVGQQKPLIDSYPDAVAQHHGSSVVASIGGWPHVNMRNSHPLPYLPTLPSQKHIRGQFGSMDPRNALMNQGPNKPYVPRHQPDSTEFRVPNKLPQFPNQHAGQYSFNQQSLSQTTTFQPQIPMHQELRPNLVPPSAVSNPSHLVVPPSNRGYMPPSVASNPPLSHAFPGMQAPMPIMNIPNSSSQLRGGAMPPLPPGPHPSSLQMVPASQNPGAVASDPPPGSALSGLIGSLVAQGLISLTQQAPVQGSVGVEFDPDLLKTRHESAIAALYADLPRQCTTCGLRFKFQEEHSSHMDWHVTKNRISRNRKQNASRKWFVSASMWLRGAEALGAEAVPGFLPTEDLVEKKDEEELAVPADEDQKSCALCGESFDDFYSDETEEWMYKGAVYMNAPSGSAAGADRSQLGPIVHAKCRSESSSASPEDFAKFGGLQLQSSNPPVPHAFPVMQALMPFMNMLDNSCQLSGGAIPLLPLEPRPVSLQTIPLTENLGAIASKTRPGSALSGTSNSSIVNADDGLSNTGDEDSCSTHAGDAFAIATHLQIQLPSYNPVTVEKATQYHFTLVVKTLNINGAASTTPTRAGPCLRNTDSSTEITATTIGRTVEKLPEQHQQSQEIK
ncbi:hypothetical protein RJ640_005549 [Escallonia rubra]|uniref:CID domain-containing protein n=1 Tax=Escallonia rubra TaxID=112253 RepID=A0AA88U8U5_9ASTE|nr:hypothetical protein RJ640_005549 [Escallonia rubra]